MTSADSTSIRPSSLASSAPIQREPASKHKLTWAAITVLALNLWISFLVVPIIYHPQLRRGAVMVIAGIPLLALVVGLVRRGHWLLIVGFPLSLLVPVIAHPPLVGVNIYSSLSFPIVGVALVAHIIGGSWLLGRTAAVVDPTHTRRLPGMADTPKWRRRLRVYRGMAVLAAVFPAALIHALFLRSDVIEELRRFYPERAGAAAMLFGVLGLVLWLWLFFAAFASPLRAHIRGDPRLSARLARLQSSTHDRRPRRLFFVYVAAALTLMTALYFWLQHPSS